jgi:hypothetical protein
MRGLAAAAIGASVSVLLSGCIAQSIEIQKAWDALRPVYEVKANGYSYGELKRGVAGIDYINPNAHFEATADDAAITPAQHCKNVLAYAAKIGADEWLADPDYAATPVAASPAQALAHCVQTLQRGSSFQMQGAFKGTPIRIELAPNAFAVSSAIGEGYALEHRKVTLGMREVGTFLDVLAQTRIDNPSLDPLSPEVFDKALGAYELGGKFTPLVGGDGLIHRVSFESTEKGFTPSCVSVDPWNEAMIGIPDPGPPGYSITWVDKQEDLKSFGQKTFELCKPE